MPLEVMELMKLYPQPVQQSGVEFLPIDLPRRVIRASSQERNGRTRLTSSRRGGRLTGYCRRISASPRLGRSPLQAIEMLADVRRLCRRMSKRDGAVESNAGFFVTAQAA